MNFQAYAFSVDISRAYRNFRSDPLDWPLLGVTFEGNVYIDIAMLFGARMSSLYMQNVAEFITRSLRTENLKVLIYLDDVVGVASTEDKAMHNFQRVKDLLLALGLPLAEAKSVPPRAV